MPVKRVLAAAAACLAATAIALAVTVAATSAATSAQHPPPDRGNDGTLKEWDTDNLAAGSIGAKNYRIPFHDYNGEKRTEWAKACYRIFPTAGTWPLEGQVVFLPGNYGGNCSTGTRPLTIGCLIRQADGSWRIDPPVAFSSVYYSGLRLGCLGNTNTVNDWQVCGTAAPYSVSRDCAGEGLTRVVVTDTAFRHAGCRFAVADAFFQTGGDTGAVNDFPIMEYGSESEAGRVSATGVRDSGCADFAEQQDRLVTSMGGNGGWYLDSEGNLRKNAGEVPSRVLARPAAVYGTWAAKGASYYYLQRYITATLPSTSTSSESLAAEDSSYDLRADQRESLDVGGAPLWERVLATVAEKWNTRGNCSAVIGATRPADIQGAREIAGPDMVFLVPGIGAQGGDAKAVAQADPFANLVINSSRSITNSPHPNQAAANLHRQINQAADS